MKPDLLIWPIKVKYLERGKTNLHFRYLGSFVDVHRDNAN